jgi:hypothetical protein
MQCVADNLYLPVWRKAKVLQLRAEPFEKHYVFVVIGPDQLRITPAFSGTQYAYLLARWVNTGNDHLQDDILPLASAGIGDQGFGPVAEWLTDLSATLNIHDVLRQVDQPDVAGLALRFGRTADFFRDHQWCEHGLR